MAVLLLLGEQEVTFNPHAALNRARSLLPHCDGEILPNVGHALTMEQPDTANARILTFLANATTYN